MSVIADRGLVFNCYNTSSRYTVSWHYRISVGLGDYDLLYDTDTSSFRDVNCSRGRHDHSSTNPNYADFHNCYSPCYFRPSDSCPKGWGTITSYNLFEPGCYYGSYYPECDVSLTYCGLVCRSQGKEYSTGSGYWEYYLSDGPGSCDWVTDSYPFSWSEFRDCNCSSADHNHTPNSFHTYRLYDCVGVPVVVALGLAPEVGAVALAIMPTSQVAVSVAIIQMDGWGSGREQLYQITSEGGDINLGTASSYCGLYVQLYRPSHFYVRGCLSSGLNQIYYSSDTTDYSEIFPLCISSFVPSVSGVYYACGTSSSPSSPLPSRCPRSWGYIGPSATHTLPVTSHLDRSYSIPYDTLHTAPQYLGRSNHRKRNSPFWRSVILLRLRLLLLHSLRRQSG